MKKVGIMGGTFNPIHLGHLFLAENAYEQLGLDEVLFLPSKNPPHKEYPYQVTQQQRVEMITLAIEDNPHFELSTMELEREGITYTADTLTMLNKQHPNVEFYFIIGADSLFSLHYWMNPQVIFNSCTVVAANRDNSDHNLLIQQIECLKETFNANIILIDMPAMQISSEMIRENIATGKSVRYTLTDKVLEYIQKNKLYHS